MKAELNTIFIAIIDIIVRWAMPTAVVALKKIPVAPKIVITGADEFPRGRGYFTITNTLPICSTYNDSPSSSYELTDLHPSPCIS